MRNCEMHFCFFPFISRDLCDYYLGLATFQPFWGAFFKVCFCSFFLVLLFIECSKFFLDFLQKPAWQNLQTTNQKCKDPWESQKNCCVRPLSVQQPLEDWENLGKSCKIWKDLHRHFFGSKDDVTCAVCKHKNPVATERKLLQKAVQGRCWTYFLVGLNFLWKFSSRTFLIHDHPRYFSTQFTRYRLVFDMGGVMNVIFFV